MVDNNPYVIFNDNPVTGDEIVAAARSCIGLKYTNHQSFVYYEDGVLKGKVSCIGFVFLVGVLAGKLPNGFDINIQRPDKNVSWEELVNQILLNNFTQITAEEAGKGDIIKMRYHDVDPNAPWHVAIQTTDIGPPKGSMIHSLNGEVRGTGEVLEQRIDALEATRIESFWRVKGYVNG